MTSHASNVAVEARRENGIPIAKYRIGQRKDVGDFYLLALKLEETAPLRDPLAALLNETITLVVTSNGVDRAQQTFTVSERGHVQRIDFGSGSTNVLSGFELWAINHGLPPSSQNLDADADSSSNLSEFIAGTGPTDPSSKFLLRIAPTNSRPQVSFDALRAEGIGYESSTRHYALQQRAQIPGGSWETVPGYSNILGENQVVHYEPPAQASPRLFRGLVWLVSRGTLGEFRLALGSSESQSSISFLAFGSDSPGISHYYTLEYATNLESTWFAVPNFSNVLGSGQTIIHKISTTGARAFYRGRIESRP